MPKNDNPFAQVSAYWNIFCPVPKHAVAATEEAFADISLAVSSFETNEERGEWLVEILCENELPKKEIAARLGPVESAFKLKPIDWRCEKLVQQDWLSKVAKDFPPIRVGRYFVHGTHVKERPSGNIVPIHVDAGAAFGSGEHATTFGCLLALHKLAGKRRFNNMLDMGCGSGILAIAMAKTWKKPVLAIDVDAVAVRVTRANARDNKVERWLSAYAGDGYRQREVGQSGPYDLIVSNILARPLMRFAKSLKRNLAPGGFVILSGLLANQERMVLSAHRAQGLRLTGRISLNGWNTLILR